MTTLSGCSPVMMQLRSQHNCDTLTMDTSHADWNTILDGHPIFCPRDAHRKDVELATHETTAAEISSPGRRQTMVMKDAELIVAVGDEIRMTPLTESKGLKNGVKSYKVSQLFFACDTVAEAL